MAETVDRDVELIYRGSEGAPILNREAATLNNKVLVSKRRRNASLPIARLPDEVLATIFEESSAKLRIFPRFLFTPHGSGRSRIQQLLEARQIVITHVCHRWRAVALSIFKLWNDIHVDGHIPVEAFQECVKRSKATLLTLSLHIDYVENDGTHELNSPDWLPAILQELSRTRVLNLTMPTYDLCESVWETASSSSLQTFIINEGGVSEALPESITTFTESFGQRFPNLLTLELNRFALDLKEWSLPPTLTRLAICSVIRSLGTYYTDVLHALRRLPGLRQLSMSGPLGVDAAPFFVPPSGPVSLPQLQDLQLRGFAKGYIHLLDYLEISLTGALTLEVRVDTYSELGDHRSLSHYVPPQLHLSSLAIIFAEESAVSAACFTIEGWRANHRLDYLKRVGLWQGRSADLNLCVKADVPLDPPLPTGFSSLHDLIATIPVSNLRTVYIQCDYYNQQVLKAQSAFTRMSNVDKLGISGSGYPINCAAWILYHTDGSIPFPQLSYLLLERLDFSDGFTSFLDILRRRQEVAQVRWIVLRDCSNLTSTVLEDLRGVVSSCQVYEEE